MTPPRRCAEEHGQITAMLVIFAICLLLAISAVINIAASYLRRQEATSLADGAALSASDAAAAAVVHGSPDAAYVAIDQGAATAAVEAYLRLTGAHSSYPGLKSHVLVDANTVIVSLSMPFELPVSLPGVAARPRSTPAGQQSCPSIEAQALC